MAEILLTRGLVAIVDDADHSDLSKHKWHASVCKYGRPSAVRFVARIGGKGKSRQVLLTMARVITGAGKGQIVDHINRNPLDNRRCNLRLANSYQNTWNQKVKSDKASSRYKGVFGCKNPKRWPAMIRVLGKLKYLGSFSSEVDAARAYDAAAIHHFGEFAMTNAMLGLYDDQEALCFHSQINKIPD